jgi:cell wall-associated NlpC family hydrolase
MRFKQWIIIIAVFSSCKRYANPFGESNSYPEKDTVLFPAKLVPYDTTAISAPESIPRKSVVTPVKMEQSQLVSFAKTLIGVHYKYASTDPSYGFDCSGFISYVFNHFGITVPRSSVDFTNYGKEISLSDAKPGDLILFTGTDSTTHVVGHMGIVTENINGGLQFIHSTSGKAYGVTISPLDGYYAERFVKVIRVL